MKKYTKPTVEVIELSVKESLSALPKAFTGSAQTFSFKRAAVNGSMASVYLKTSNPTSNTPS